MKVEPVGRIDFAEKPPGRRFDSQRVFSEVLSYLPGDLLTCITILLQDTGYISIRPIKLTRADWYRLDRTVKKMGEGNVWETA